MPKEKRDSWTQWLEEYYEPRYNPLYNKQEVLLI